MHVVNVVLDDLTQVKHDIAELILLKHVFFGKMLFAPLEYALLLRVLSLTRSLSKVT